MVFGLSVVILATVASCTTDNQVDGGGSGITQGTPVPTVVEPTSSPSADHTATPTAVTGAIATPATPAVTATVSSATATAIPGATATSGPAASATPTATSIPTPVAPATLTPTPAASPTATVTPEMQPLKALQLERAFAWSSPIRPTHLEEASDGSGRVYVSEQAGRILELTGDPTAEQGGERTVLDIRSRVSTNGNEEGLLGFALHPEFAQNRKMFVYYSAADPRRSVVSEFTFQANGIVDPGSERNVLLVSQPQSNHNGGMLAFGPDGYLYISLGDGGGSGDQGNNAQNPANVLGSILRIDVDTPGQAYGIPADNPFVSGGGAPEIWAYGLRNPWRFSFDTQTGDLWAADVGQDRIEEIDLIVKGGNYGWRLKEGPDCFNPSTNCDPGGLVEPVASYSDSFGCSVTGGYVYRGSLLPSLFGAYVYADYCSGITWGLRYSNGAVQEQIVLIDSSHRISAFGQTLDGEVYLLTHSPGIFRFVDG